MTVKSTLNHILHYYVRVLLDTFSSNSPKYIQAFHKDCESLVERYNSILKDISSYLRNYSKLQEEDPTNCELSLT